MFMLFMQIKLNTYIYIYIFTYLHIYIYTYIYIYLYNKSYVYTMYNKLYIYNRVIYSYIHIFIYIYIYVYMCIYIYIYIHIHIVYFQASIIWHTASSRRRDWGNSGRFVCFRFIITIMIAITIVMIIIVIVIVIVELPGSQAARQPGSRAAEQPSSRAAGQPVSRAASLLATKGRTILMASSAKRRSTSSATLCRLRVRNKPSTSAASQNQSNAQKDSVDLDTTFKPFGWREGVQRHSGQDGFQTTQTCLGSSKSTADVAVLGYAQARWHFDHAGPSIAHDFCAPRLRDLLQARLNRKPNPSINGLLE